MRVLLTGVTGFIGSHLAERLLSDGHEVVGLSRGRLSFDNIVDIFHHPRFSYVAADIREDPLDREIDGCDVVTHLAARTGMVASWTHFDEFLSTNAKGTQRLLEMAVEARVSQFLYVSSSSVYGSVADGAEDSPLRPCNPYGASKAAGELLCHAYHECSGMPITIVRPFSVYGPRQRPDMAHRLFISALIEGRTIMIDGDGHQRRSNTYVEDLVDGIVRAATLHDGCHVFNLGGDHSISILELIDLLGNASGIVPRMRFGPAKLGDQRRTEADCHRAASLLGWLPRTSLRDGLVTQIEWQRELMRCV